MLILSSLKSNSLRERSNRFLKAGAPNLRMYSSGSLASSTLRIRHSTPTSPSKAKALEAALELGKKMGFKTENFDNYVGHIEMGEGEEMQGAENVKCCNRAYGWSITTNLTITATF